jgi:mevalonate kinase
MDGIFSGQSPGKFILGGEHSVVSRGRALSFPLEQVELKLSWGEDPQCNGGLEGYTLNSQYFGLAKEWQTLQKLFSTLAKILAQHESRLPKASWINIESSIPIGSGLGSSAALGFATANSLCAFFKTLDLNFKVPNSEDLARATLEGEKIYHQSPSGIDPFTVCLGRPLVFSKTPEIRYSILDTQFFKKKNLIFILFPTGVSHNTREVQRRVSGLQARDPLIWGNLLDQLASNVELMKKAIDLENENELGQIMNDSHFRLAQLGVSTESIENQANEIRRLPGILGAKITGAGCGGYLLGLFRSDEIPREIASRILAKKNPWSFLSSKSLLSWSP